MTSTVFSLLGYLPVVLALGSLVPSSGFPPGVTVFPAVNDFSFHLVKCPLGILTLNQHSPKML